MVWEPLVVTIRGAVGEVLIWHFGSCNEFINPTKRPANNTAVKGSIAKFY